MRSPSEQTQSVWMNVDPPSFPRLSKDTQADVVIVGAGIAGLSAAYALARDGRSVVVLDDGPIGGGQTQRTTAHLSNVIDDRFVELERIHGEEGARLAAESHAAAIDRIEKTVRDENINCDFMRLDGYLFEAHGETESVLDAEYEAAKRAGIFDVELVPQAPAPSFDTGRCLRFKRQGQFHPLKYLAGLAKAIQRLGGVIHSESHAAHIEGGPSAIVETDRGSRVKADAVIVATNTPVNDMVAIHTKQAPYLTYAVSGPVPSLSITRALYWDTLDPYHYVRIQLGVENDLLIVGGEDHKAGQATDQVERFGRLEAWARERFPMLGPIDYRWSGMVMETIDGLAFIGRNPMDKENVFVATGDSGMGMTHGTIAGMLLADLIAGRDNPWARLYDPSRKPLAGRAWKDFLSENLNVVGQMAKDWFTGGDISSTDELAPGQGAIIRRGLTKVAVYRDTHGNLHEYSAACPHLDCIVHWNGAEKTWDCPCHGSRFDAFGRVLNGPANSDLCEEHAEAKPTSAATV